MADDDPAVTLGEVIRRQRELNRLSMRQFAQMAGISNPYLSQIERGLRAPSEQVLEAMVHERAGGDGAGPARAPAATQSPRSSSRSES